MGTFLDGIRRKEKFLPAYRQIINTGVILLLGIALGVFSKYLDCTPVNRLPRILEYLDVGNFLGRFAIWLLLGLCISTYSASPFRAAIHVFLFFAGMVGSYYLYSKLIAGFFPKSYTLIWVGFTAASPLLGILCWYARGRGKAALGLSSLLIAVLFNESFAYGWLYFDPYSILELITFLCGAVVLRRKSAKETMIMLGIGVLMALLLHGMLPIWG